MIEEEEPWGGLLSDENIVKHLIQTHPFSLEEELEMVSTAEGETEMTLEEALKELKTKYDFELPKSGEMMGDLINRILVLIAKVSVSRENK